MPAYSNGMGWHNLSVIHCVDSPCLVFTAAHIIYRCIVFVVLHNCRQELYFEMLDARSSVVFCFTYLLIACLFIHSWHALLWYIYG